MLTQEQRRLRSLGVPPRFQHLTNEQAGLVCNGCGGKGGRVPIPDFLYEACCNRHDFSYWLGGTEDDRRLADYGFLLAMLRDADRRAAPRRWWLRTIAWAYYRAVRMWGASYFNYQEGKRGWDDLDGVAR